ncbi:uncharacterized protein N7500_000835 [Penicillium coprophilum]|uniref:uncharacterized protein n=1 Tax=Penicillium coprophilum TaxID=36646 RepID=UPI0023994ABB|nr:uncharacterized protein N7500_000835 [Penicillium coprophilum]KAJ5178136.1 hypothetical protein N7500_000835 [Penicillium coprophilum]
MSSIAQTILPIAVPITTFFLSVGAFFHLANVPHPQRLILSPLMYIPAGVSFATSNWWLGDLNSLWGLLLCIWVGHSTSLLFIEDLRVWEDGDYLGRISKLAPHIPGKYYKGLKLWNNPLLLGTSYQFVKIPKSAACSPSLARFTVLRLGKVAAYVGAYFYIKSHVFPAAFIPLRIDEFGPLHQVYFRRLSSQIVPITLRETLMRCAFVLWWTFSAVAMLDSAHAALSLLSVSLLRFDEPSEWPPIFGSLGQAWTIRRFWGKFWHQIVRRTYTNYGECISRKILVLQPRSLPDKVLIIFVIFFLSGVSHAAVSWQLGDHCGWPLDIWWFCTNFVAGLLEVVVTQLFRALMKKVGKKSQLKWLDESIWSRVFGFVWVFSFMFWSIPKWQYPKLYCHLGDALAQTR